MTIPIEDWHLSPQITCKVPTVGFICDIRNVFPNQVIMCAIKTVFLLFEVRELKFMDEH